MKKVLMVIVAMFGIIAMSNAATTAATEMGISTLAATTVDYVGDFTKVDMNGSTKAPVKDKVTTVVSDGATISSLVSEAFQVGKMPGTIKITASNLTIDPSTGNFSGACTVTLKTVREKDYAGTISGTIANGKLVYDVKCLATWLGIAFDTAVTFEGNE